jgi:hypothetical protein
MVPKGAVRRFGDAGVKADLDQGPATAHADSRGQFEDVEIRERVSEGVFSGVEEILPVEKCDGRLRRGLNRHLASAQKITPPEVLQRPTSGEQFRYALTYTPATTNRQTKFVRFREISAIVIREKTAKTLSSSDVTYFFVSIYEF